MIHLTCTTGALHLENYFDGVENSVKTVAMLVQDSFEGMPYEDLESQVERARNLFGRVAYNTNGVLTYYFRIDPEISQTVKGFWYTNQDGEGFKEHEVTDITQYDTNDTSSLVWFTVPKATGKGVWLPPYYTENLDVRVISYNVPVYWEEQFVGVIGIEIDYEILAREVENIRIYDSGYAFILDEDSNVIYHPQMDSVKLDLEISAVDDTDRFIGSNHIKYNFEGVEKEAVWMPLSNGMRLYVAAPLSEIDKSWHNMVWNILIAALVILVVVNFISISFANRLTKPLHDLTEATIHAEHGNYEFELDYDKDDEVGILTNAFKELTAHTQNHINDLNEKVYVDALTSVRNKRGYGAYIQKLQDQIDASEESPQFAFGVFDCNNLKLINDNYGHDKGDAFLITASQFICRIFQHSPVFRIGGDEFAVILQNEDYQNMNDLLDSFKRSSKEISETAENKWDRVNVAMGVAVYDPELDSSVIDVARRADQLMYENKRRRKEKE
jgi:diguanylate cyclase (GGDEF)-like protein